MAVVYISPRGERKYSEEAAGEVLLAFQRLSGRSDAQEKDFRRLLARLAPEEIKGVLLGDYLLGRPAGRGGFATVHVGVQLRTGRRVAIKVLDDGLPESARARFQQEAVYLSRMAHPNIVGVIGYGEGPWSPPRLIDLGSEAWYREFARSSPVKSYTVPRNFMRIR
jgi:serine/threonine protein kinase